ncbi:MAG: DUF885 domain-containing protein [Parvularculaceae bacterium]|nr:DUF885 domain-containing protein [Parvularculaceae bacterium]
MRVIRNVFFGALGLIAIIAAGAWVWFWASPVGVNNYINKIMLEQAMETPELLSQLGFIDNTPLDFHSGKLADYTKAQEDRQLAKLKKARAGLDRYGPEGLKDQELLSWKITAWFLDDIIRQSEFDHSGYVVNQISGATVNLPQFLTDIHQIKTEKSVKRYVSRLEEFGRVLGEVKARVEDDRRAGVAPPDFIIEKTLVGLRSFIEGGAEKNSLVTTLPEKLKKIGLSEEKQASYVAAAQAAVAEKIIPGYEAMIALFEDMKDETNHDAGIWRIPEGDKIYETALQSWTTTTLTAGELHQTGLAEVARIEGEMNAILDAQGVAAGATIAERVKLVNDLPGQIYPNTPEGKKAMIDYLVSLNDEVMAKAKDYFITLPPQKVEIVPYPAYQENSAPGGSYQPPALDGSRPGRFYINQKDTADNPRWTLPTLLYHEAAPGHHFQLSSAQLIKGVPIIRKVLPFSAYAEGWALYAERVAAEDMGLYKDDPFGDLGRLQAEMFRAVRLVVDTGMHEKRWSREQAIAYMMEKTGMSAAEVEREIERYVVWPGQATAYKTGQLAILKLRAEAEQRLGEKFDLREFHEVILGNGGMPLGILEGNVRAWIEKEKGA